MSHKVDFVRLGHIYPPYTPKPTCTYDTLIINYLIPLTIGSFNGMKVYIIFLLINRLAEHEKSSITYTCTYIGSYGEGGACLDNVYVH